MNEKLYTCPECGKAFAKIKQLHGHMLLMHKTEYQLHNFRLAEYGIIFDKRERLKPTFDARVIEHAKREGYEKR